MAVPVGNLYSKPVVAAATSDDGGLTWSSPVAATTRINPLAQFNDKLMLWADNNPASAL